MNALGLYLVVCLAFVICALLEFAISIVLHGRKESKAVSGDAMNKPDNKTKNKLASISHIMNEDQTAIEWDSDALTPKKSVETNKMDNKWVSELGENLSIVPSTNVIDFMAIWIYMLIFIVFNGIYWNAY